MNDYVKNRDWHISLAKHMHYKYKGYDLHGKWELEFAKYLDYNNIEWDRPKTRFKYIFEDKERYYTPDFYLIETDEYVEIKGFKTEKDYAKWNQFNYKTQLIVLMEKDLKELKII
jgi:deoxycytidine triphosphate deaminase